MAQYLILIYQDEQAMSKMSEAELGQLGADHNTFTEKAAAALRGGNALHYTDTATSIRPSGGEFAVTDGAFAETKEALGGYYLVEAEDLDAAIELAKLVPSPHGGLEVRPIMVFS
jgi:hypothetical protein